MFPQHDLISLLLSNPAPARTLPASFDRKANQGAGRDFDAHELRARFHHGGEINFPTQMQFNSLRIKTNNIDKRINCFIGLFVE
jgi:hypothetical protein